MSDWRQPEPPDTRIDDARRQAAQERIAILRAQLAECRHPADIIRNQQPDRRTP